MPPVLAGGFFTTEPLGNPIQTHRNYQKGREGTPLWTQGGFPDEAGIWRILDSDMDFDMPSFIQRMALSAFHEKAGSGLRARLKAERDREA